MFRCLLFSLIISSPLPEYQKFSPMFQFFSLEYLRRAFTIISHTDTADDCDIMIETLVESTDLKKLVVGE